MSNFKINFEEPWTSYDNKLIQEETVFENPYQKLGYMFLYSYARAKKIFPSMEKIAGAICCKKKHAIKVIKQLEDMGFIEVVREAGKSNQYTLNDYFAIAEIIRSKELVSDEHQCPIDTSTQQTPVPNEHHTGVQQTPVKEKPVSNGHPKTRLEKTINKNSISLARLNLNFDMDSTDKLLKSIFPELPFDQIKEQLLKDIEAQEIECKNANQYKGILKYRLDDYLRSKQPYKAKVKQPIRKEILPDWFEEEKEHRVNMPEKTEEEKKADMEELKKLYEQMGVTWKE